jgi:hypothetical protein
VLESAGMILYSDSTIRTDETVDFNSPNTAPIDRQNKTAFVIDKAVPLTHNLAKTEVEEITKCENLALEIKNIWKPNNVVYIPLSHLSRRTGHQKLPTISGSLTTLSIYPSVISAEELVTRNFLQYLQL